MLCDPVSPLKSATRIKARIVLFNVEIPITKGFMVNNKKKPTTLSHVCFNGIIKIVIGSNERL
jgi:hypothetical protein